MGSDGADARNALGPSQAVTFTNMRNNGNCLNVVNAPILDGGPVTFEAWFKVDDNLALHPKVLGAGNAAMGMWVRAGSWSAPPPQVFGPTQPLTSAISPPRSSPAASRRRRSPSASDALTILPT